jgi:hypothetical protein
VLFTRANFSGIAEALFVAAIPAMGWRISGFLNRGIGNGHFFRSGNRR